jgi:hypothetical protein
MSKDMNVTIWPIWQSGVDDTEYADVGKEWPVNVGYQMYAKRLIDTELAAEWHRTASVEFAAMGDPSAYKVGAQQRAGIERETLTRFATLPHASDNDYA